MGIFDKLFGKKKSVTINTEQNDAKDRDEYIADLRKAAAQGDSTVVDFQAAADIRTVDDQLFVGILYAHGRGVAQNDAKAFKWIQKAAEQGLDRAQFNLGEMFEHGRGATQSYEKAREWYQKAAKQGHEGAKEALKRLLK